MVWVPQWDDREDGISGLSVDDLTEIGNAINRRTDFTTELAGLQGRSRIPLTALLEKKGGSLPGSGVHAARTPEEALYFASASLQAANAHDARMGYETGISHNLLDSALGDVADIERAIASGSIGRDYSETLRDSAEWSFKSGIDSAPVEIAKAERAAKALHEHRLTARTSRQQARSLAAIRNPARELVKVDGAFRWVDKVPESEPASIGRFAGDRLVQPDASQIIYNVMEGKGRFLASDFVGALPETDAIRAARLIEALRATGQYSQGLGGSNAMDGFAAGVLSTAPLRVQQMAQELAGSLISDKAPALWMRHANGNPNNIHALEGKPVGVEFLAQPNSAYVAVHDSNKRSEYGYLVDGRHRDKVVPLANAKEAASYAEWLGNKGWFTNYVDPLGGLTGIRQFSPVGGDFVAWEERARGTGRLR